MASYSRNQLVPHPPVWYKMLRFDRGPEIEVPVIACQKFTIETATALDRSLVTFSPQVTVAFRSEALGDGSDRVALCGADVQPLCPLVYREYVSR